MNIWLWFGHDDLIYFGNLEHSWYSVALEIINDMTAQLRNVIFGSQKPVNWVIKSEWIIFAALIASMYAFCFGIHIIT